MVKVPFGCFGDVWVDVSKIPKISAWNLGHLKVPRLLAPKHQDLFPLLRLLLPGMAGWLDLVLRRKTSHVLEASTMNAEPMASRYADLVDLFFFRWKIVHYFFA